MKDKTLIMIVDDDPNIAQLVKLYLEKDGYDTVAYGRGDEALAAFRQNPPSLMILDIMLPDIDGFEVCRNIRATNKQIGIIMLTARTQEMDKVTGLMTGADDYVTKPFNPLELVARVKTQLRRYTKYNQGDKADETVTEYDFSGLVINSETHKCTLYGKPLALTPIEFSILWHLCQNRGKVVSSEELFEAVWGEKYLDNNNTVMAHVARLRDKMHEPSRRPKFVKTVWGVGYTIE